MKKHWKKILLVLGAVVLAAAGYLLYILKFKDYDVADEEIEEITNETYKIEMPDGKTIEFDEDGNMIESGSSDGKVAAAEKDDSDSVGSTGNHSNGSDSSSTGNSNSGSGQSVNSSNSGGSSMGNTEGSGGSTGEVTVASIKDKYTPVMNQLSAQANGKIDALVGRAANEYQTKKANGEKIDYGYFYNKYTSAASELEGRTDNAFYKMVSVVEKELEKNGFSKSHAQSFVKEYEASKESRRKALLDKAMNR